VQVTVTAVSAEAEFESLRSEWTELHACSPNHTPFQSWEWNYAWWKHFGVPGSLRLLLVRDGSQLIGIAPLRTTKSR
jgi:CelD/BcsL family acetyltransferase involved in cellulose biosynthesis